MKFIKRLNSFFKDLNAFGFSISVYELIFPLIMKLPQVLSIYFIKKHNNKVALILKNDFKEILQKYALKTNQLSPDADLPIWVCWLQGETNMPTIPKLCLKRIRNHCKMHPVILISEVNIEEYIDLPEFIMNKYKAGKISNAHYADIIRIFLLSKYGGCWIDSTLLLTKDLENEVFEYPFYSIKFRNNNLFISENKWSNFFIAGHKGCVLYVYLEEIFIAYLKKYDRFIDYFLMDHFIKLAYDSVPVVKEMIDKVPINNINTHKLAPVLLEEYNPNVINMITTSTYIFKLSWRMNIEKIIKSNFEYLLGL